jgi:hypothetical protein
VISHVDSFSKIAVVLSNGILSVDDPLFFQKAIYPAKIADAPGFFACRILSWQAPACRLRQKSH